ncbi:MAG: hypothetical protein IH959_10750 [Chloroflexi bacterium]|nr:hypothetical protein [Chloroflexota bacterium]
MTKLLMLLPLPLIAVAIGALLPIWVLSSSWPAGADDSGPRMALNVAGEGTSCDAASEPTECVVPLAGQFTLAVEVIGAPDGGYVGIQTQVFYGGLAYQPRNLADEIFWPETALPVRFPAAPTGQEGLVSHGDASSTQPPFPASSHTGNIVEIALSCSAQPRRFTLALLPYGPATRALGAGFRAAAPDGGIGETVPAKTVGTASLDLDGDTTVEAVGVADGLAISCGDTTQTPADTPTPTQTATDTPTPTATATDTATPPRLPGDANCDRNVDSIDAALILQSDAGIIDSLGCPQNADVNEDGSITSSDALLILQLEAGLIVLVPPPVAAIEGLFWHWLGWR